jgi:hypothetical protein
MKINSFENWSELQLLEKKVRQKIGAFALNKDPKLSQATRWVERAENIQKKYEGLLQEVSESLHEGKNLLSSNPIIHPPSVTSSQNDFDSETSGGKARGRQCRLAYVAKQARQGKPLTRVSGALYRNGANLVVGIAYANERENEWFLGLPADQFKEAVLLCETSDRIVQPIYLPENFIKKFERHLSVSRQYSQAKFNVYRQSGRFYLQVKGFEDVELTSYLGESLEMD